LSDRRSDDKEKLLVFSDLHCIFQRTNATVVCLHESCFRSVEFLLDNGKQNLNLFCDLFTCCELQILLVMLLAIPNWQDISHYSCLSVETNFWFLFSRPKIYALHVDLYRTWACYVCAENLWPSSKSSIVQYSLELLT